MTGLLSYSELDTISFIDLVHAHEVINLKEQTMSGLFEMIGDTLGKL